jgi:hypothetical protein
MGRHVKWDVRTGGDGALHVTRTQVSRSTTRDGARVTEIDTSHVKTTVTRGN